MSRDAIGELRFDESLDAYEDLEFWLRLAEHGVMWACTDEIINAYCIHADGLSRRFLQMGDSCCRVLRAAARRTGSGDEGEVGVAGTCAHRMLTYATRHVVVHGTSGIDEAWAALREQIGEGILIDVDAAASAAWFGVIFGLGEAPQERLRRDSTLGAFASAWWERLVRENAAVEDLAERAWSLLSERGAQSCWTPGYASAG